MNWNFLKTNWFVIALVLLVLGAIVRDKGKFPLQQYFSSGDPKPGLTSSESIAATTLGIGSEPTPGVSAPVEIDQATATSFLKRFAPVAISERKKFGIPASVLLASAFLNSHSGLNEAALNANNFFAIPCSDQWEGSTISLGDRCVRKYETPWASWRDFSIHLSSQQWFGSLRQSAGKDWQKWAKGLSGKGVSTVSTFGQKMAEVIKYYRLYELDPK